MALNLSKGLLGLSQGLGGMADFKLKQEADEAKYLRDQHMAEYKSSLLDKRQIASETRSTEARIATEDRATKAATELRGAKTKEGLLHMESVNKKTQELATKNELDSMAKLYPGLSEQGVSDKVSALKRVELESKLAPKAVPWETKTKLLELAQSDVDMEDANYTPEDRDIAVNSRLQQYFIMLGAGGKSKSDVSKMIAQLKSERVTKKQYREIEDDPGAHYGMAIALGNLSKAANIKRYVDAERPDVTLPTLAEPPTVAPSGVTGSFEAPDTSGAPARRALETARGNIESLFPKSTINLNRQSKARQAELRAQGMPEAEIKRTIEREFKAKGLL